MIVKHNNLFLFIFWHSGMPFGYSQVIEIEGTTFGNNNIPISSCTIVASDSENGSNILAFKNSDASGNYKLILSRN
jgi:hypothetical protein